MGLALYMVMRRDKMTNIMEIMAIAGIILINSYGLSFAGSSNAKIMVTATVVARVNQSIIHQESRITVTDEDIKRGFIEIPSGTILQVKTNDRKGYGLFFEGSNELFKEVMVMDKGRTVVLSLNGGFVHQPYSGRNIEVKDLSYKLHLKEDIQPGTYPWPFRVKASLL
jgi:hypothetical protein